MTRTITLQPRNKETIYVFGNVGEVVLIADVFEISENENGEVTSRANLGNIKIRCRRRTADIYLDLRIPSLEALKQLNEEIKHWALKLWKEFS